MAIVGKAKDNTPGFELTEAFDMERWRNIEKPSIESFTFNGVVNNTETGMKLDKLRQLLYYYHDEALKEDANLNGFSYSAQAKKLVTFFETIMQAYRDYAVGPAAEEVERVFLKIEYEGVIGQPSTVNSDAFTITANPFLEITKRDSQVINIFLSSANLTPVIAGYLENLERISYIADPIYKKPREQMSGGEKFLHDCDTSAIPSVGIVGMIQGERVKGGSKNKAYVSWYEFSRDFNAFPYSATLGPKKKEDASFDNAPDKDKKTTTKSDWEYYRENFKTAGPALEKTWNETLDFFKSFEFVGDDFFTEENLKKLANEITEATQLYQRVLNRVCPSVLIGKVVECNLGASDCKELLKIVGGPVLLPLIDLFAASDSKYQDMKAQIEQTLQTLNAFVVRLRRKQTIKIKSDEEIKSLYSSNDGFSVSMNLGASLLLNSAGTKIAQHKGAWQVSVADRHGRVAIDIFSGNEGRLSFKTKEPILTADENTFINLSFSVLDGELEIYSSGERLEKEEQKNQEELENGEIKSYQLNEGVIGEEAEDHIIIGSDLFRGQVDNFKLFNVAQQSFVEGGFGTSEEDVSTEEMVIWLRLGDDNRDSIDETNREVLSNRLFNHPDLNQEYYGTPEGFSFRGTKGIGFEVGIVQVDAPIDGVIDEIIETIDGYIDINAFCTVLIRYVLEGSGAQFPTFDMPRVGLIRPFGNFFFQVNEAVVRAISSILVGLIMNLIDKLIDCNILNAKNAADLLTGTIEGRLDTISEMAGKGISEELDSAVRQIAPMIQNLATFGINLGNEGQTPSGQQVVDSFTLEANLALRSQIRARGSSAFSALEDSLNKYSDLDVVRANDAEITVDQGSPIFLPNEPTNSATESMLLMQSVSTVSQELSPYENISLMSGEADDDVVEKARLALPESLKNAFEGKNDILGSTFAVIGQIAGLKDIKKEVTATAETEVKEQPSFQTCQTVADIRERVLDERLRRGEITEEQREQELAAAKKAKEEALQAAFAAIKQLGGDNSELIASARDSVPMPEFLENIIEKVFRKVIDPVKISYDKDMKLYKASIAKKKIHEKKIDKVLYKGEDITFRNLQDNKFVEQIGTVEKTIVNPEFQALLSTGYIPLKEDGVTVDGTPEGGFLARNEDLEYIDETRIYKKNEFGEDRGIDAKFRDAESVGPYTDFDNPKAIRKIETNILMGNLRDHLERETLFNNFFFGREVDKGAFKDLGDTTPITIDLLSVYESAAIAALSEDIGNVVLDVMTKNGIVPSMADQDSTVVENTILEATTFQLLNSISDLHDILYMQRINFENNNTSPSPAYIQLVRVLRVLETIYRENIYNSPDNYSLAIDNVVANSSFYGLRGQTSETALTDIAVQGGYTDPALQNDFNVRFADTFSSTYENETTLFLERFGRTPYSVTAKIVNRLPEDLWLEVSSFNEALTECFDEKYAEEAGETAFKMTSQERLFNSLMKTYWMKALTTPDDQLQRDDYDAIVRQKLIKPTYDMESDTDSSVFTRVTKEILSFLTSELSTNPLVTEIEGTYNDDTGENLIGAHFLNFNPTQSPAHKLANPQVDPRIFNFDSIYNLGVQLYKHLESQQDAGFNLTGLSSVDTPMSTTLEVMSALMLIRTYCLEYVLQAIVPTLHYNKGIDQLTKEIIKGKMFSDMEASFGMTRKMGEAIVKANNKLVEIKFVHNTKEGTYYNFADRATVDEPSTNREANLNALNTVLDYLIEQEYKQITTRLRQMVNNTCAISEVTEEEGQERNLALRGEFLDTLVSLSVSPDRLSRLSDKELGEGRLVLERYVRGEDGSILTKVRRFFLEGETNPDMTTYDFDWDEEEYLLSNDAETYGIRIAYVEAQEAQFQDNQYGVQERARKDSEIDQQIIDAVNLEAAENEQAYVQEVGSTSSKKVFVHVLAAAEMTRDEVLAGLGVEDQCELMDFFEIDDSQKMRTNHKALTFEMNYCNTDDVDYNYSIPDFENIKSKTIQIEPHYHNSPVLVDSNYQGMTDSVQRLRGGELLEFQESGERLWDSIYLGINKYMVGDHSHGVVGPGIQQQNLKVKFNVWLTKASALRGANSDVSNWSPFVKQFAETTDENGFRVELENPGLLTDKSLRFMGKSQDQVQRMIDEYNQDYPWTVVDGERITPLKRDSINNYMLVEYEVSLPHNHALSDQTPLKFDENLSDRMYGLLKAKLMNEPSFRMMFGFCFDLDKYTSLVSSYAFLANTSQEFEQMFSQTKQNVASIAAIGSQLSDYSKSFEECNASQASKAFELPAASWNPDLLLFMLKTPLQVYKGWVKTADPHALITQTIVELLKTGYIIPKIEEKQIPIPNSSPPACLPVNIPVFPGTRVDFPGLTQVTALSVTYAPLVVGAPPFIPTPFGLIYYAAVDPLLFLLDGLSSTDIEANIDLQNALNKAGLSIRQNGSCILCDEDGEVQMPSPEGETEDTSFSKCEPYELKLFNPLNQAKFGKVRGC